MALLKREGYGATMNYLWIDLSNNTITKQANTEEGQRKLQSELSFFSHCKSFALSFPIPTILSTGSNSYTMTYYKDYTPLVDCVSEERVSRVFSYLHELHTNTKRTVSKEECIQRTKDEVVTKLHQRFQSMRTVKCELQEHSNVTAGGAGADIKVSCNSHFRHPKGWLAVKPASTYDWRVRNSGLPEFQPSVPLERAPNGTSFLDAIAHIKTIQGKPLPSFEEAVEYLWTRCKVLLEKEECVFSLIHGDCNFQNILVGPDEHLVFIDPRGYFGSYGSPYGLPAYDRAKVVFALTGYDRFDRAKSAPPLFIEHGHCTIPSLAYFPFDLCKFSQLEEVLAISIWLGNPHVFWNAGYHDKAIWSYLYAMGLLVQSQERDGIIKQSTFDTSSLSSPGFTA